MKAYTIFIVEDNETMRLGIRDTLKNRGYQVFEFDNGVEALDNLRRIRPHLVISDLKMEPMDGIELLQQVKEISPESEVLMISAYGTVEIAVKSMQLGAADFLTKPFSSEELGIRVAKIVEKIEKQRVFDQLKATSDLLQSDIASRYEDIIGQSPAMQQLYQMIEKVAAETSSVLIEGESGTGKELVARAIHRKSPRAEKPFIPVNCAALSDNLLESELFGHEKGAFTGAFRQKKGRFELADGGTLFLDEIGDISPAMQVKILRAVQEKEFERVGGEQTLSVDVRIIAATNKNLNKLISEGKFREDLYYRIGVIPLKIPPLRNRKEDIPLLVEHFLEKLRKTKSVQDARITPEGMKLLQEYSWPGNIRELENLLERLVVISGGGEISPQLIASHLGGTPFRGDNYQNLPLDEALWVFEKNLIMDALKKADGVKNRAAKILGIRTSALYYKLEKFGLME
ncbi:MAG: sigma-54 dependent transcriptional regulator [Calditrichia bacterium]